MGGDPEFSPGDLKVLEGAHLAVGLVGNVRARIIIKLVIPPGKRNRVIPLFMARLAAQTSSGLFPRAFKRLIPVMATRSGASLWGVTLCNPWPIPKDGVSLASPEPGGDCEIESVAPPKG